MNSTIKTAGRVVGELNQTNESNDMKKEDKKRTKARLGEFLKHKQESKVMHGQCIRNIDRELVSEHDLSLWLLRGDVNAQTERVIIAANISHYKPNVMQQKY
jgi:ribosomal protein S4